MSSDNGNTVSTPFGQCDLGTREHGAVVIGRADSGAKCFLPACDRLAAVNSRVICMRQAVRLRQDQGQEGEEPEFIVFVEASCSEHADLMKARREKKQISLTQKTCLRNALGTLDIITGRTLANRISNLVEATTVKS